MPGPDAVSQLTRCPNAATGDIDVDVASARMVGIDPAAPVAGSDDPEISNVDCDVAGAKAIRAYVAIAPDTIGVVPGSPERAIAAGAVDVDEDIRRVVARMLDKDAVR